MEVEFQSKLKDLEDEIATLHSLVSSLKSFEVQESAEILVFINFLISSLSLVVLKLHGSNTFKVKNELKRVQKYFEKVKVKHLRVDDKAAKRMVTAGLGLTERKL